MDSGCPLRHCCCVHVRQLRGLGESSCRALSGQRLHPPVAESARFRSLFWARWALHQKGLPKDVCRYITRKYLTRAAFHDETEELRQERIPAPYPLPVNWCVRFSTWPLRLETGALVMKHCLVKEPRLHYRQESRSGDRCLHKKLWIRVRRPPVEPIETFWRHGVCVVRTSSSLARPYDIPDLEAAPRQPEPQEPPQP